MVIVGMFSFPVVSDRQKRPIAIKVSQKAVVRKRLKHYLQQQGCIKIFPFWGDTHLVLVAEFEFSFIPLFIIFHVV